MVQKFAIPIGGVIVNEVLRPEVALQDGAGEYLANKYHEQTAYMKVLYRDLGPLVRSYIPLYSSEVGGVAMIRQVSEDMMSYQPPFAAELAGGALGRRPGGPKSRPAHSSLSPPTFSLS